MIHDIIKNIYIGCQPDEPLASLVTTNRIINVYGFIVVIMLLMYFSFVSCILLGIKLLQLHIGPLQCLSLQGNHPYIMTTMTPAQLASSQ